MVRRAERGIGQAVRNGQHADPPTITSRRDTGWTARNLQNPLTKLKPEQFFPAGGGAQTDAYTMTDGVSDEQFEVVLEEAKAEGNISRTNVVRKLKTARKKGPAAS